jgi:hypothetical protein
MLTAGKDIGHSPAQNLQFGHADRARDELIKHTTHINGTMLETALRPHIPLEPAIYKYFLKGERIAKERIY